MEPTDSVPWNHLINFGASMRDVDESIRRQLMESAVVAVPRHCWMFGLILALFLTLATLSFGGRPCDRPPITFD
jgi:hypothetical protein